jgi:hypothetical protein
MLTADDFGIGIEDVATATGFGGVGAAAATGLLPAAIFKDASSFGSSESSVLIFTP